jgi:hypothetical protein
LGRLIGVALHVKKRSHEYALSDGSGGEAAKDCHQHKGTADERSDADKSDVSVSDWDCGSCEPLMPSPRNNEHKPGGKDQKPPEKGEGLSWIKSWCSNDE